MAKRGYIDTNPNVGVSDQNRAQALDWLRRAEHYVVIVPTPEEAKDAGPIAVLASADGEFLVAALTGLTHAVDLTAARFLLDDIAERDDG